VLQPTRAPFEQTLELIGDIQQGRLGDARSRLASIVAGASSAPNPASEGVLLACTELPLVFGEFDGPVIKMRDGLSYLDSVAAHVEAVAACAQW
jgi:aspartate/glutamate racemase